MNALVVGCGSIGKRHINNLIKFDNIQTIFIYTKVNNCPEVFLNNSKIRLIDSSANLIVNVLNNDKIDFAIVANETNKHIDTAITLADHGVNLFVEKPLSHNLEGVDILKESIRSKNIKIFIGYNLRFLNAMQNLKGKLNNGALGDLYFAKIEVGQYLPSWRSGMDYRKSYSAIRAKGGGVSLDLSHEVDYMRFLFGEPSYWKVERSKVSDLEIDCEDVFEGIYKYSNGFICTVHMDYLQLEKKRDIRIVGSEGRLECNFIKKEIRTIGKSSNTLINNKEMFDTDKTYVDELTSFIESVEKDVDSVISLDDGIKTLNLLEDRIVQR